MRRVPSVLGQGALLCCSLFAAPAVLAQASPWYIGAAQSFTHDSNVYLLGRDTPTPAGVSRSDTVSTTSLLAGLDQPIGRQRLYGNASLRNTRYSDNGQLDNNGYGLSAGLDWETVNRLSGSVTLGANRNLARFTSSSTPSGIELRRNIESSERFGAIGRIGVVTKLTAELGVDWRRVRYSAPEYDFRENDQTGLSAGLRWRLGGSTVLGAGLRRTEGKYPNVARTSTAAAISDRFTRNDLELSGNFTPGGASSLDARLSLGKTEYERSSARDFSGVTGSVGWNWTPSGKLRLRTQLWRDSGQDAYFFDNGFVSGIADYSRVTTSLRVRADYAATAKINTYGAVTYADRALENSATPSGGSTVGVSGNDRGTTLALGATWAPTRNTLLGCDWSRETRDGAPGLQVALRTGTYGCYGQIFLR